MYKVILTFTTAALIAGTAIPAASSEERPRVHAARPCTCKQARNAHTYAKPYAAPDDAAPGYSGDMGGWGSMTGFN